MSERLQKITDAAIALLAVTEGICKTHCPDCGRPHAINQKSQGCILQAMQSALIEAVTGNPVYSSEKEFS